LDVPRVLREIWVGEGRREREREGGEMREKATSKGRQR